MLRYFGRYLLRTALLSVANEPLSTRDVTEQVAATTRVLQGSGLHTQLLRAEMEMPLQPKETEMEMPLQPKETEMEMPLQPKETEMEMPLQSKEMEMEMQVQPKSMMKELQQKKMELKKQLQQKTVHVLQKKLRGQQTEIELQQMKMQRQRNQMEGELEHKEFEMEMALQRSESAKEHLKWQLHAKQQSLIPLYNRNALEQIVRRLAKRENCEVWWSNGERAGSLNVPRTMAKLRDALPHMTDEHIREESQPVFVALSAALHAVPDRMSIESAAWHGLTPAEQSFMNWVLDRSQKSK